MTALLEQAFSEASKLRNSEQDMVAKWLLDLLASEQQWSEQFASSQDVLAQLADEALAEYRAGATRVLDPGQL